MLVSARWAPESLVSSSFASYAGMLPSICYNHIFRFRTMLDLFLATSRNYNSVVLPWEAAEVSEVCTFGVKGSS